MRAARLGQEWDAVFADAGQGIVSRQVFGDPTIYRNELERIFARCWVFVGHESQIPNPGDFVTSYVGEDAIILTRDKQGRVNAVLNSCRHRGNRVCRVDEGHATSFVCPYHGWTYDTEGSLIGVPGFRDLYHGELNREQWGLLKARTENYKGLIFATFNDSTPSLADYLGDIRWGIDIVVDQRPGGMEAVGVFKWIINCNWKFAADNFIGDTYHGAISHRSAMMIGHGDGGRHARVVYRKKRSAFARTGITISTGNGHGLNADTLPSDAPPPKDVEEASVLDRYYRETSAEVAGHLGHYRAEKIVRINATVFPNLSLSSSSRVLHVWHPRGPFKTEIWAYTLVDRDAPTEVKEAMRLASQRHFGPAGLFEQDDGENWEQSTLACRGVIAGRYPLNYQMGLGYDDVVDDGTTPPRVESIINEHNQRSFYRRWAELMRQESD